MTARLQYFFTVLTKRGRNNFRNMTRIDKVVLNAVGFADVRRSIMCSTPASSSTVIEHRDRDQQPQSSGWVAEPTPNLGNFQQNQQSSSQGSHYSWGMNTEAYQVKAYLRAVLTRSTQIMILVDHNGRVEAFSQVAQVWIQQVGGIQLQVGEALNQPDHPLQQLGLIQAQDWNSDRQATPWSVERQIQLPGSDRDRDAGNSDQLTPDFHSFLSSQRYRIDYAPILSEERTEEGCEDPVDSNHPQDPEGKVTPLEAEDLEGSQTTQAPQDPANLEKQGSLSNPERSRRASDPQEPSIPAALLGLCLTITPLTPPKQTPGWELSTSGSSNTCEIPRQTEEQLRTLLQETVDVVTLLRPDGTIRYENPSARQVLGYSLWERIGQPVLDYVHLGDRACLQRVLDQLAQSNYPSTVVEYRFLTASGTWIHLESVISRLQVEPTICALVLCSRDITERKLAEVRLRLQNAYLAALHETSLALIERLEPSQLLQTIVNRLTELLDAPKGFLFLVEPDQQVLELKVGVGEFTQQVGLRIRYGEGLIGSVWQTGQILWNYSWLNSRNDPALSNQQLSSGDLTFESKLFDPAAVAIPLKVGDRILGVLGLGDTLADRTFTQEELELLERFGQIASITLAHVQLDTDAQHQLAERQRAEAALAEEKERLAITLRSIGDGVITTDLEGHILLINAAAETLTGWSQAEALGQPATAVLSLVHVQTRQAVPDPVNQAIQQGHSVGLPNYTVLIARDGSERFISASAAPIHDPSGEIRGVVLTFRDVTRHKQTEEALRQSQAQNQAIFNASPDQLFRLNREGQFLDFKGDSRGFLAPPDQVVGKRLEEILPIEVAHQTRQAIKATLDTQQLQWFDYQLPLPQGAREFEARLAICGSDQVLAVVRDVTERKRAAAEKQRQAEREQLFGSIALRIRRSLDLDEILQTTAAEIRKLLQNDRVLVYQFQPNGDGWVIAEAVQEPFPRALGQVIKQEWFGNLHAIYQRGQGRAIERLDHDSSLLSQPLRAFLHQLNVKSNLVVPLFPSGRLWGILVAHQCSETRQWQTDELALLEKLATQVEIAIQQSQLYQQVQTLNDELERKVRIRTTQLNKQLGALKLQTQLLDRVGNAVMATDVNGQVIYWNAYAQDLFGVCEDVALGELITEVIPFSRQQAHGVMQALSRGEKWSGELDVIQADGLTVTVVVEHSPMRDQGGDILGTIGISVDITERKQAEHALRESEAKFRTLAETTTSAIFIFQDQFLDVNSALTQITGYSKGELLHMPIWELIHPDFQAIARHRVKLQFHHPLETYQHEFKIRTRTGVEKWIDCTTGWIRFKGEPAVLGTAVDITQRKQSELELQRKMQELQQLNFLKDDFLSTVSHELRTPMSNMRMAIHMLKMMLPGDDPEATWFTKATRYLNILQDECLRETDLINDLLDLQRLEAGSQVLDFEPIELAEWLPKILEPFESRIRQRQQRLSLRIYPDLPPLYSDQAGLGRILSELINNACKYSPPEAEIRITVVASGTHSGSYPLPEPEIIVGSSVEPGSAAPSGSRDSHATNDILVSKQPNRIRLTITNTGVEITPTQLARIFDKFYRIPGGDQWKQGGTGLGLALVKRLVEQMQGQIWVESQANQTQFCVELPCFPELNIEDQDVKN